MHRIRISCFLLFTYFLGTLTLFAQEMSPQAQALAAQGVQLQTSGDYAAAAVAYKKVLEIVPNDIATHVNLGVVLVSLGRFDEAIEQYDVAGKLLPHDPRIALNKALAYEKSGRLSQADKLFDILHREYPAEAKYTMLLADCQSQLGNSERVIQLLQPLYSAGTSDGALLYMLGTALLNSGRVQESERVLDPLLRDANSAEAHFVLGMKAFETADYPGAANQFAQALAVNPKLPQLQSFYGRALLNSGDPAAAGTAFQEALMATPNDFWANLELGQILIVKKDFSKAAPLLQRALLLRPQSTESKLAYSEALLVEGQAAQSRPLAEAAVAEFPKSLEAHRTLQSVYLALHLTTLAKSERQKVSILAQSEQVDVPYMNTLAPDFTLPSSPSGNSFHLQSYRGKSPVVLVFGSYSCPNFRASADALKTLSQRYSAGIPFFLVYIREAHADGQWQSTRNQREHIETVPVNSYVEKQEHASMCSLKLHLPFPALVDGMDGTVEAAYHAWPSRAFIIGEDGKVLYSTRLSELDFRAAEMESVLRKLYHGRGPNEKRTIR